MVTQLAEFSNRLNEALDDVGVPPKGKGRQIAVGTMFGVTQKAARKWLEAEGMPNTRRLGDIARRLEVKLEWLMSGSLPKRVDPADALQEEWLEIYRQIGPQKAAAFARFIRESEAATRVTSPAEEARRFSQDMRATIIRSRKKVSRRGRSSAGDVRGVPPRED